MNSDWTRHHLEAINDSSMSIQSKQLVGFSTGASPPYLVVILSLELLSAHRHARANYLEQRQNQDISFVVPLQASKWS